MLCFFFQAEDGIRDHCVTGVQTCALPISKVAAWMAGERGLAAVLPQRGWEALKAINWSVQKPRPRHPAAATPEEREAFKKSSSRPSLRREPSTRTRRSKSGPRTSTALA